MEWIQNLALKYKSFTYAYITDVRLFYFPYGPKYEINDMKKDYSTTGWAEVLN